MDICDPRKVKPRKLTVEPKVAKSRTEIDDPNLAMPYTVSTLPSRRKLLSEREDPKCT
jgi:hypothetical protein